MRRYIMMLCVAVLLMQYSVLDILAITESHRFSANSLKNITICSGVLKDIRKESSKQKTRKGNRKILRLRLQVTDVLHGKEISEQDVIDIIWIPTLTSGRTVYNISTNAEIIVCINRVNKMWHVIGGNMESFSDGCPVQIVSEDGEKNRVQTALELVYEKDVKVRRARLESLIVGDDEVLVRYASKRMLAIVQKSEDSKLRQQLADEFLLIRDKATTSSKMKLYMDRMLVQLLTDTYKESDDRKMFLKAIETQSYNKKEDDIFHDLLGKMKAVEEKNKQSRNAP